MKTITVASQPPDMKSGDPVTFVNGNLYAFTSKPPRPNAFAPLVRKLKWPIRQWNGFWIPRRMERAMEREQKG